MRDSGGLSAPSTSVLSTSELPNSEDLSSSSLWKQDFIDFLESTRGGAEMGHWCAYGVWHTDLLQSFTGNPSIFALMTLLLFLIAERTASSRKPGHLSSFTISLHAHRPVIILKSNTQTQTDVKRTFTFGSSWAPPAPGTGWSSARSSQRWCLAPPSWWNTACPDPSAPPLTDSGTLVLSEEDWTDGTEVRPSGVRSEIWNSWEALKLGACLQALCRFCPAVWTGIQSLWFSPSGRPPCRPSSPPSSSAGPAERSACAAAPYSFSWNVPIAPEATNTDKYYAQIQLSELNWTPTKQVLSQIKSSCRD